VLGYWSWFDMVGDSLRSGERINKQPNVLIFLLYTLWLKKSSR
jgi:hypothetical protein